MNFVNLYCKTRFNSIKVILKLSLLSRFLVILLQFVSISLLPQHDAKVYQMVYFSSQNSSNNLVDKIAINLAGFSRWDSQYFLSIAKDGYLQKFFLPFFPLQPLMNRFLTRILFNNNLKVENFHSQYLVTCVSINCFLFTLNSILVYLLTLATFESRDRKQDELFALQTAILFVFNPASIFFTACYSESLFCFLTLIAFLFLETNNYQIYSALLFGLSALVRSNGIFTAVILLFHRLSSIFLRPNKKGANFASILFASTSDLIVLLIPFCYYQYYSYAVICQSHKIEDDADYCSSSLPSLPYSHVQKKYWNVGLFNYWKMKKLPNFFLASPTIVLACWTIYGCCKYQFKQLTTSKSLLIALKVSRKTNSIWTNERCKPYLLHLLITLMICIFYVHIEVTTRIVFSSTPIIYWTIASSRAKMRKYFTIYSSIYLIVGTILHSSWYPWT